MSLSPYDEVKCLTKRKLRLYITDSASSGAMIYCSIHSCYEFSELFTVENNKVIGVVV